ncbi:hypothetical protein BHE74_00053548, partial [Ensete ventricosum]
RVEFRSVFCVPSRKFKILVTPDVLAHGKSYEHDFVKKCDGHKRCAKSRAYSSFDRFFVHRLGNSKYWPFPNILAHGKSYAHGFTKKCDGHKLCTKSRAESSFDSFSCTILEIQNIGHSRHISPWEVIRTRFHEKTQWS